MKPYTLENQDTETLAQVGRASLQIVHDLKNQLNGVKLYATFLHRRIIKDARPGDERETIEKLIAGLNHAAEDAGALVRFARPLEVKRKSTELARVLPSFIEAPPKNARGAFDAPLLNEALTLINDNLPAAPPRATAHIEQAESDVKLVIIWHDLMLPPDAAPFDSFVKTAGLRLAFAAKIIRAHGGTIAHDAISVRVTLPLEVDIHQSSLDDL